MAKKELGELLVQENKISVEQLSRAKTEQKTNGGKLSSAFVKLGYMTESEMLDFVAQQHNVQTIDLNHFEIAKEIIELVPKDLCVKHTLIPVMKSLGTLVVACADPGNLFIRDDLQFVTQSRVEMVVSSEAAIVAAINRYYESEAMGTVISDLESSDINVDTDRIDSVDTESGEIDEPIIRFVNLMLTESISMGASDIHIEPYEKRFRIRFRIDGQLHEKIQPPGGASKAVINRIKILANLDISEKRRPQDGRIKIRRKGGAEMEFRVSSIPSLFGEKIVLRLLDKSGLGKPMTELGFEVDDLALFKKAISRPVGIVLVTGPTGSGKSTTVYSALQELNKPDVNLCTAEDPVEMNIEGINHVQANPAIDLTFSSILRSFLRQDPDIIFVGEIRDLDTAEVAFKAASTGHLVISTLHTNDAPATVIRLTEIGIAPFLVTSTVSLVVAQRLVGRICPSCKVPASVTDEVLIDLGVPPEEVSEYKPMTGEGCSQCNATGIKGRVAIHEVMEITSGLKEAVLNGASTMELRKIAVAEGMRSLRKNALLKLKEGLTNIEQVMAATIKD